MTEQVDYILIEKTIQAAIKNKIIASDDSMRARTLITWLKYGREEAEKICKGYCKRIEDSGCAIGDKLLLDDKHEEHFDIWFASVIGAMKGHLKQTNTEIK
jgi:hypothetical protein